MSPVLHTEHLPRVPGCESGHAPKQYPAGRVCAVPGCGFCLSVYNRGDECFMHRAHAQAQENGPSTRATKEEKMGTESLRMGPKTTVLMVFARDPSRCFNAGDVVKSCGVSPSCVYQNLKALVASGEIVKDAPGVYHWPKTEDVKTAPASPPAPAPDTSREQPADVEAAPESLPPQVGPPPFAGIDYELHVIGALVSQIESLSGHETRVRVAAYVASRFLP